MVFIGIVSGKLKFKNQEWKRGGYHCLPSIGGDYLTGQAVKECFFEVVYEEALKLKKA
jgi:hypothetical protein